MKTHTLLLYLCKKLLELLHCKKEEKTVETLAQFIEFCLSGVISTVLSFLLNIVALFLLRPFSFPYDYIIANLFAFLISVAWSFFWNSRFVFHTTFKGRHGKFKMLLKTYASDSFTGIILSNILSWLWIDKLAISKYIAPLINLIISVPINFLMNKFWAFKER